MDLSPLERWSPLAGLLFVALFLLTFLSPFADDTGETAQDIVAYADDASGWIEWALVFALLSLILLGLFVSGLYARLRRFEVSPWDVLALVGGTAFTILFFLAMTLWSAPLAELDDEPGAVQTAQAQTFLAIEDVGWFVLGGAGVGAGLMIIASSLAAMRAASAAGWMGWGGVALGILSLATVAFFGIFAWLLWLVIASVAMLAASRRPKGEGV